MKQSNTRSFITALGLTLAASGVWAQSAAPAASACVPRCSSSLRRTLLL